MSDVQKFGEEFQRAGKDGFDASVRSLGEWNKGFQAIAATVADYSKKSFPRTASVPSSSLLA